MIFLKKPIIEIKQNPDIEHFFLFDQEGIKKYLKLTTTTTKNFNEKGCEKLKQYFSKQIENILKGPLLVN